MSSEATAATTATTNDSKEGKEGKEKGKKGGAASSKDVIKTVKGMADWEPEQVRIELIFR